MAVTRYYPEYQPEAHPEGYLVTYEDYERVLNMLRDLHGVVSAEAPHLLSEDSGAGLWEVELEMDIKEVLR